MPSAASSTTRRRATAAARAPENGSSASASPRPSGPSRDARGDQQRSRLAAVPLRLPFATSSPSIRTCRNIACGSSSSAVTTHGPIAIGTPSRARRPARRSRRAPASRSRACSRTGVADASRVIAGRSRARAPRRPSARTRATRRPPATAPPARARRSAAPRRATRATAATRGTTGSRMRGRLTRQSMTSSRRQRVARGIHDGASAARDETLERGGEGRVPDGVGQVDHLTLEDRPQSPLPPAVVGDEPHQGAEAYARPTDRNHAAEASVLPADGRVSGTARGRALADHAG